MSKRIAILGAGISGIAAGSFLARDGYEVQIIEKNKDIGGRCRQFSDRGFHFDMGPSWYWMPDVFERYFNQFGADVNELLDLRRLDPSYRVFFEDGPLDIPANFDELKTLFDSLESGAGDKLASFLAEAEKKYKISMADLVFRPSLSALEFVNWNVLKSLFSMDLFQSFETHTKKYFKNPKLLQLMEFPILFLGATAKSTPALYSLMNYADIKLGTWYPMGGMYELIRAMRQVAEEQGVKFVTDSEIHSFDFRQKEMTSANNGTAKYNADAFIAAMDYRHMDRLLGHESNYKEDYWDKRKLAPSSLLFYLGINKKIDGLEHHNLFFDTDFGLHAHEIYHDPKWPTSPLFYVCCPSKTDPSVAPVDHENLFLLMPIAPGLEDSEELREEYYQLMIKRLESQLGTSIKEHVIVKHSYCKKDFEADYHAFKGNAYGLANVLTQTAILKPRMKHKKIKNLYYTGQLTVPGPGMPPSLISGEIVAELIKKETH